MFNWFSDGGDNLSVNLDVKREEIDMCGCTVPRIIDTNTAWLHFWAAVKSGIESTHSVCRLDSAVPKVL